MHSSLEVAVVHSLEVVPVQDSEALAQAGHEHHPRAGCVPERVQQLEGQQRTRVVVDSQGQLDAILSLQATTATHTWWWC